MKNVKRFFTDVPCLFLFIGFIGGWIFIGFLSIKNGDKNEAALYRLGGFLQVSDFAEGVFNDLAKTYWMIGIALIGACILSFIWIVLMRFLAGFMIWTTILIVFLGLGGLFSYSGYRLYRAYLDTDPVAQKNIFQVKSEITNYEFYTSLSVKLDS